MLGPDWSLTSGSLLFHIGVPDVLFLTSTRHEFPFRAIEVALVENVLRSAFLGPRVGFAVVQDQRSHPSLLGAWWLPG